VDREEAMSLLPFPYATALRLVDEGVTEPVIARAVGVELTAVGPLLRVAHSKLDELMLDQSTED
jgi:hypothetical protein